MNIPGRIPEEALELARRIGSLTSESEPEAIIVSLCERLGRLEATRRRRAEVGAPGQMANAPRARATLRGERPLWCRRASEVTRALVVDTSVLIAIIEDEPGSSAFVRALEAAENR